ncbi:MAG: hypothetical protein HY836_16155 [Aquabacterium sp.]|uniref:hypothetical protein n=1 Tax=Aquabacterium sp. TaxID=1872578 RepID=UPI0025BD9334|nr:hypothetical protein [Aquabacterium sp.]MBI5927124.1 hypothetical protein [Aquabacterium sp.]
MFTLATGALRPSLIALIAFSLLSGVVGGLLRAGVPVFQAIPSEWVITTASQHAALMICGFLGTVIGVERATAIHAPWTFLAPISSALGGLFLTTGHAGISLWLFVLAALVFVMVNVFIVGRQATVHTYLLVLSALLWLAGNVRFMLHGLHNATLTAWFAFLVFTIAAERLEMARLTRPHAFSLPLLGSALAIVLAGTVVIEWHDSIGCVLFGTGLLALALWLIRFDIARHTVKAPGLSRYMAACLLTGYAWLGVSGLCWVALGMGQSTRDAALHALALGFIMSMIMGHAPVILPSVAGIKLHVDARFYLPLALLHFSLFVRLAPGHANAIWQAHGGMLNALAILAFALTVVSAIWSWRRRHPEQRPDRRRTNRLRH